MTLVKNPESMRNTSLTITLRYYCYLVSKIVIRYSVILLEYHVVKILLEEYNEKYFEQETVY